MAGRKERYTRKDSRTNAAPSGACLILTHAVLRGSGRPAHSSLSPGSSAGRTSSCKDESITAFAGLPGSSYGKKERFGCSGPGDTIEDAWEKRNHPGRVFLGYGENTRGTTNKLQSSISCGFGMGVITFWSRDGVPDSSFQAPDFWLYMIPFFLAATNAPCLSLA